MFWSVVVTMGIGISSSSLADTWKTDAKVGLMGRSYPVGAQFNGTFGLSAPLWGDTSAWKYGYVRGALNAATSAVVNRLGAEVQLFPISILGVSAGWESTLRSFRAPFVSCVTYQCFGRVDRKFLKASAFAAAKGVIFNYNFRYDRLSSPGNDLRPFYDEMTLISGQHGGEDVITMNPILLYTLDPTLRVGGVSVWTRGLTTGNFSHLYGPAVSKNFSPETNGVVGLGLNESSLVHSAITLFFMFTHTFEPSMAVTDIPLRTVPYSSLF